MPGKKKRILVCPLDWGIGHATRCVPVIRALCDQGAEVIPAADGRPLEFLEDYFPELQPVVFPGINISYPAYGSMALRMLSMIPGILRSVSEEHQRLDGIIDRLSVDGVVSDNRFGCWSEKVPSVYITHQVMIKTTVILRFLEPFLYRAHRRYMEKYDELWIPDLPGAKNLSGDLSHRYPLPGHSYFVGPLSRFQSAGKSREQLKRTENRHMLVILSGPEPQRSILENMVTEQASGIPGWNITLLQGLPGATHPGKVGKNLEVLAHLPDQKLLEQMYSSDIIVCRPGYSTLMDLAFLGLSAVLVPTPGQTEQEYLASIHAEGGTFISLEQKKFRLERVVSLKIGSQEPFRDDQNDLLQQRIAHFLGRIR